MQQLLTKCVNQVYW